MSTPSIPRQVSAPLAQSATSLLVNFQPTRRSFVLHNGREKPMETMFRGNMMTVPGVREVHPIKAAKDADGDPIPGTYLLEDQYEFFPQLGDDLLVFDAERAVIHILGIRRDGNGRATEATSSWALAGLSLLPPNAPKSTWEPLAEEGRRRAFIRTVENAHLIKNAHDIANDKRKEAGKPAVDGGAEYRRAVFVINKYEELAAKEYDMREEGDGFVEEQEAKAAEDAFEFEVFLKARVRELVDKAASKMNVDKVALFEELINDPTVRKHAQATRHFRKKGFSTIPEEELDAAARAGQTVKQAGLEGESEVEKAKREQRAAADAARAVDAAERDIE